ncbi:MAG: hypothetical protein WC806_00900 [Candidatus Gracilibacteria bacterium]|jgi:CRISPR/Cas system CSM-associated protein Csm4 (group 5 of RAMP superfamily)
MIEDQIPLMLQNIDKLKNHLKEVKKDIKDEEKIDTEKYIELKKAYKEMKAQFKEYEEEELRDLKSDESYAKLIEIRMKAEEDLANARVKLFEAISKLPQKFFEMSMDTERGPVKVQIVPDMRVFLNGKEEKKKM